MCLHYRSCLKSKLKCLDFTALVLFILIFHFVNCVRDSGIQLDKEPSDVIVAPGGSAVLDCTARAEDGLNHEVKWRSSDGQYLIPPKDEYRKTLANGSLLLSNVFSGREGDSNGGLEKYQCQVSSENYGTIISRTASVSIARLPQFEKQPGNLQVYTGQTAHFSCIVNARPSAKAKWSKNQYPLVLDPLRMSILPSGSLEIDDVEMSDAGIYQCNVSNILGYRASDRAELLVKSAYDSESSRMAPIFVATPRSSVVVENENITFDCAANGFPTPVLTWLKDGAMIDMADLDSRFSIIGSGSLQITKVKAEDGGNYACRATNKEDSADASATLTVQVPPRFIQKPQTKFAHEKDELDLPCEVYGVPKPKVTWLKNAEIINYNDYIKTVNGHNLHISGALDLDSGVFQCVASNEAGNIQAAAKLTVLKSEEIVSTSTEPENSENPFTSPAPISPSLSIGEKVKSKSRAGLAAPKDLKATSVSKRYVILHWEPADFSDEEVDGYSVFYREKDSLRERVVNVTKHQLGDVNISGLQPNRTYGFRVVAVAADKTGESTNVLSVTTQGEAHVAGPPTQVTAKVLSTSAISVQWQPPQITNGPIVKYQLFYVEEDVAMERYKETTELQYELTGLSTFTVYSIWVVAHNSNGPGVNSAEVRVRTYSSAPSKQPQNVSVKPFSSTVVSVSWEPPPKDGQNGIITGYKLRYKKGDKKSKGETVTTAGDRRMYSLEDLDRSSVYQIRLWALNVNGSGPPTEWYMVETYENDLIETTVPDAPGTFFARPMSNSIFLTWTPPLDTSIMVRSYTINWGKNVPDMYSKVVNGKQSNSFTITDLEPNSEYIISLRASNEMGDGPPKYANVRTQSESAFEATSPLIPPIGLKASILSPTSAVLYWSDTTLPQGQFVTDDRIYVVRCTQYHPTSSGSRSRFYNASDLNLMITDLKPITQYEFTVKLVKGRRESLWSMVVLNTTFEDAPSTPPMDLTVVPSEGNPSTVILNWQPPKVANGRILGYHVSYTYNALNRENQWELERVVGDKMTTTIKNLLPNTTYFFKIQARTKGGVGPMSNNVSLTTPANNGLHQFESGHFVKDSKEIAKTSIILYVGISCGVLSLVLFGVIAAVICCRKNNNLESSKKEYMKAGASSGKSKMQTTSIKPPDLWIHHDQMELKAMEKSSQGSLDTTSGGGPSSNNLSREFDAPDHHHETRVHHHTPSVMTNSLDKRSYVSSYVGNPSEQPLLYEEKTSTLRRAPKSKPITIQMDRHSPCSNSSSDIVETQPLYPRPHYSISRAHVTVDPSGATENTYIIQSTVGNYESVNNTSTSQLPSTPVQGQNYGNNAEAKRLQGHPLKSFSVPAPPPQSAPSTPQQKHVVTVRPQGSSSPYKKAAQAAPSTSAPINTTSSKPWQSDLLQLSKIQPSYSTEELNQEMANLEGLMKDLNAITASEFEC